MAGAWVRAGWFAVYAGAAAMALLRSGACSEKPSMLVDPYWLEFWLFDYSNGFRRRALLGTIFRWFAGERPSVVVVSALAMAACLAMLVTLVWWLHRRAEDFWGRAALAVILASPLTSVLFEVLGDPLEIVFVLFLACVLGLSRVASSKAKLALALGFSVVAILVHEAAIFLFVPAIVLLLPRAQRAAFIAVTLLWLVVVVVVSSEATSPPIADVRAVDRSGVELPRVDAALVPLPRALESELRANFGTRTRSLELLSKIPRVWYVPWIAVLLLAGTVWRRGPGLLLRSRWLQLSACAAPLFVVAHDWGRFTAITFWVANVVVLQAAQSPPRRAILPRSMPRPSIVFAVAGCLILAADAIHRDYRYQGMPASSLLLLAPAAAAVVAWILWSKRHGNEVNAA